MTLTCPNCGNDIPIPKRMVKTIKCPFCKDKFGVEYADEEGNPPKYFWDKHPEATKAIAVAVPIISKVALWVIQHWDELFPSKELSEFSDVSCNSIDQPSCEPNPEAISEQTTEWISVDSPEGEYKLAHYGLNKRRLPKNHSASPAKKQEAHDLGIDIGNEYTLVDPYNKPYKSKST